MKFPAQERTRVPTERVRLTNFLGASDCGKEQHLSDLSLIDIKRKRKEEEEEDYSKRAKKLDICTPPGIAGVVYQLPDR